MSLSDRDAAELFPIDYTSWRYCIAIKCGVPLTAEYLSERVATLSDTGKEETKRFIKLYGTEWHQRVLVWFQRASTER
jgi:hypothetical protein